MSRTAYLVFPLAALFNSFSMTALLVVIGLAGLSDIAADIAIIQGASLALFYAFSANARNVVLAGSSNVGSITASGLLLTRLLLLIPLVVAAFFLSVDVGGAAAPLALSLILRRVCEWVGEIALARHEVLGHQGATVRVVLAETLSLSTCIAATLLLSIDLAFSALPWALAPVLALRGASLSFRNVKIDLRSLLPHFGSTGIIGSAVFVFRLSITLLAGKAQAGVLFTAFALGSLVPTIFGQALAPTLIHRRGQGRLPYSLATVPAGLVLLGVALSIVALRYPHLIPHTSQMPAFWLATGLSIVGGAVMSVASLLRTRLLHEKGGQDVFGPDLLANVLIATSVPFVFYVFGKQSLVGLYLLSSVFNLMFLVGVNSNLSIVRKRRQVFLFVLGVALFIPVFCQIDGGLFRDTVFVFDAQGAVTKLPLPLSIIFVFVGIAVLGNYWQASKSLTVLFFSALLFVLTSLVIAKGSPYQEGAKLILLAQFLIPMFGLVLGEMYGNSDDGQRLIQWAASGMLLLVLPAQLISSWMHGYTLLSPHVFLFSIYQHLQYFPMIVSALAATSCIALWDKTLLERSLVCVLMPITAIYVFSTHSIASVVGLGVVLVGFATRHLRSGPSRTQALVLLISVVLLLAIFGTARESGWLARQLMPNGQVIDQETWQGKLTWKGKLSHSPETSLPLVHGGVTERIEHWRFYYSGVVESASSFLAGHASPPDRDKHPSAHNYWLDTAYNFGLTSLLPLIFLLGWSIRVLWRVRTRVLNDSGLLGLAISVLYLLLFENMLKVGMRQPYPGIISFFLWGLLIARLDVISHQREAEV